MTCGLSLLTGDGDGEEDQVPGMIGGLGSRLGAKRVEGSWGPTGGTLLLAEDGDREEGQPPGRKGGRRSRRGAKAGKGD